MKDKDRWKQVIAITAPQSYITGQIYQRNRQNFRKSRKVNMQVEPEEWSDDDDMIVDD